MSDDLDLLVLDELIGDGIDDTIPNSLSIIDNTTDNLGVIDLGGAADAYIGSPSVYPPITNDPRSIMNAGMPLGSPVQISLEDPTLDDPLLESIRGGDPVATILDHVLTEIAEEVCYLKAYRVSNWGQDIDFSDVSAKRIRSLKSLVESIVEKEKLRNTDNVGKVDFHSKNFENVFSHFLSIIKETFEGVGIPVQYSDIFFTRLAKELDGFEKDAEKIYYGKRSK